MAHCLRRPLLSPVGLFSSKLEQRCFSNSSPFMGANTRHLQAQQPRRSPERSVRITAQEGQNLASDLGLLPDTFIHPSSKNRPSLFSSPLQAIELQWQRLLRKLKDSLVIGVYHFQMKKPRPALRLRTMAPTAVGLHRQMYTAFADADTASLKKICSDGLRDSFLARVGSRPKGEKMKWELVKYNSRSKVMSHRAATLGIEGAGIRQAVVRINSTQRLTRYKQDGTIFDGSGREKDVLEYVVIQKKVLGGREQEWQVWGTTEETTLEKLKEAKQLEIS